MIPIELEISVISIIFPIASRYTNSENNSLSVELANGSDLESSMIYEIRILIPSINEIYSLDQNYQKFNPIWTLRSTAGLKL